MRIAFDGSALRPNRTGVGYYTEHLLRHLAETLPPDDELIVLSNCTVEMTAPLPDRVRVWHDARRLPRMLWMQMRAPAMLRELDADVVHFTNGIVPIATAAPTVVTIHEIGRAHV